MSRTLRWLCLVGLAAACRDGAELFSARDHGPLPEGLVRLTLNPGEDRSPAWSANSDTLYYSAEGFEPLPPSNGVPVALARTGGPVRQLLGGVQVGGRAGIWLATPTPAPANDRLAYVEVIPFPDRLPCGTLFVSCDAALVDSLFPTLQAAVLRVRRFDEMQSPDLDPALDLALPGVEFDTTQQPEGLAGVWVIQIHPYLAAFEADRTFSFRPTWSREGDQIVFSDGVGLWIWIPASGSATPIANTADGVSPAWSPDGEWIAFTTLPRVDSISGLCLHMNAFGTANCAQERTEYSLGPRTLTLIHPDGSGRVELGPGEEPAWAPDGSALFFRRAGAIWRSAPDGSGAEPVPGAEGGREPAPSPDGRFLAFSKISDGSDHDLWLLSLAPSP